MVTKAEKAEHADEVARRSADGADGGTHLKTFVVRGEGFDAPDHPIHEANAAVVAQEAINRGLHPKDVATFRGAEVVDHDRRGVPTVALTYGVDVVPAWEDEDAESTVTPKDVVEQTEDEGGK